MTAAFPKEFFVCVASKSVPTIRFLLLARKLETRAAQLDLKVDSLNVKLCLNFELLLWGLLQNNVGSER